MGRRLNEEDVKGLEETRGFAGSPRIRGRRSLDNEIGGDKVPFLHGAWNKYQKCHEKARLSRTWEKPRAV